jgi:hypothetical protein
MRVQLLVVFVLEIEENYHYLFHICYVDLKIKKIRKFLGILFF